MHTTMRILSLTTAAQLVLHAGIGAAVAVGEQQQHQQFYRWNQPSSGLDGDAQHLETIHRRQGPPPGYHPEFGTCGSGTTCENACGANWQLCRASTSLSLFCYNSVDLGQTCCENGSGRACERGYYCAWKEFNGQTWCCKNGQSLEECGVDGIISSSSSASGSSTTSHSSTLSSSTTSESSYPTSCPSVSVVTVTSTETETETIVVSQSGGGGTDETVTSTVTVTTHGAGSISTVSVYYTVSVTITLPCSSSSSTLCSTTTTTSRPYCPAKPTHSPAYSTTITTTIPVDVVPSSTSPGVPPYSVETTPSWAGSNESIVTVVPTSSIVTAGAAKISLPQGAGWWTGLAVSLGLAVFGVLIL